MSNPSRRPATPAKRPPGWVAWLPVAGCGAAMGLFTTTLPSATGRQVALDLGLVAVGWALRSVTARSAPSPDQRQPAALPAPKPAANSAREAPPLPAPVSPPEQLAGGAVTFGDPSRRYRAAGD